MKENSLFSRRVLMHTSFSIFFLIIGLLFGVWSRWKEFYPTLLFWIVANLFYTSLLDHFRVWEHIPVGIDKTFFPTHKIICLRNNFLTYPFIIPVFLGRLPKLLSYKIGWIIFWALLFESLEFIAYLNKSIIYHYGWSLLWSLLFNLVTFTLLTIHNWKPWLAWLLSFIFIIILFIIFQPPIPR
jgi:hypothetical protein